MLLLEYKRFNFKKLTEEEFNKSKKKEEILEILGIKMFTNKRVIWMQKFCKYYRKNGKNQGFVHTDWDKIEVSKRR